MMMWLILILLVVVVALWFSGMLSALGGAMDKFKKEEHVKWDDGGRQRSGVILGPSGLRDEYPIRTDSGERVSVMELRLVAGNAPPKFAVGQEVIYCNSGVVASNSDGVYNVDLKDIANANVKASESQLS
jgi:hypothetical protein